MKKTRALTFTAVFFVCLFTFASIAAFALTGALQNNGASRTAAAPLVIKDYYITGDSDQCSYSTENSALHVNGGNVTISMVEGVTTATTAIRITGDATVTFNNVNLVNTTGASALTVRANATLILPDGTTNTFDASKMTGAGIAVFSEGDGTPNKLTIDSQGVLGNGKLVVKGSASNAGICTAFGDEISGFLEIKGGNVTSTGGTQGAGIGGGLQASGQNISITGGIVTATGGTNAAAIGGGAGSGNGSNIEINGDAVVTAIGGGTKTALDANTSCTRGLCFRRTLNDIWVSEIYGSNVTIPSDVTFPANLTLGASAEESITVPQNVAVTLPSGVTLTNDLYGTINIETDDENPENNGSVIGAGSLATKVSYRTTDGTTPPADATFTYSTNGEVQAYGTTLATLSDPLFLCWYAEEDFSGTGLDATQPVVLNAHTLWERTGYPFEVTGGSEGTDYAFDETNRVLSINTDTNLEIANTVSNVSTAWRIEVATSAPGANVTLNGVNIVTAAGAAFKIADNFANDVTITLADGSKNFLLATAVEKAGLQKSSDGSGVAGTLYIKGDTGSLTASGGVNAAAIGSALLDNGAYGSCENIEISGGYINATGGHNSGAIGSGNRGNGTNITITGGNIVASGGSAGTGIGAGHLGTGSNITISGGVVKASSLNKGAGIGGGALGKAVNVSITGGIVQATGGAALDGIAGGAAIGGSNDFSSTGNTLHGNAVLIATSGDASRAALDGFTNTQGICFSRQGEAGAWTSAMEGSVELSQDVTFPTNLAFGTQGEQTLSVKEGTVLTVPSDYYIQVNKYGSITLEQDQDNPENNGKIDCLGRILTAVWFETGGVKPTTSTNLLYMSNNEVQQYGSTLPNMDGTDFLGWYPDADFSENPINAASDVLLNTHTLYGRFGVPFVVQGGEEGTDYSFDQTNKVLNILTAEALEISNVIPQNATSWRIAIASTANGANITLNSVNITATNGAAFTIPDGASFDVQILLKDGSKNILQGKAGVASVGVPGSPGIQKRNEGTGLLIIGVPEGSAGTGELDVIGGHATAGIGGDYKKNGGNIKINAGVVNATGGNGGAAIGGGSWANVSGGSQGNNITINGGTVTARAGYAAAAIGGGWTGSGNNITIAGGTVYAYGGVPTPQDGTEGGSAIGSGFEAKDVASGNTVNGNAIVYATSGSAGRAALDGFSDTGLSQGIVFSRQSEAGIWAGALYGSVELTKDVTFPANLSVGAGDAEQTLTVAEGVTLNLGTTTLYNGAKGTITLNGEILGGKVTTAVSYVTRDGVPAPESTVLTYLENGVVKTYGTFPSVADDEFYGWFTTDTFEGDRLASNSPVELNAHTLYAKFEEMPFVITGGVKGTDYTYATASRLLEIKTNTALEIANKDQATATAARIVINGTVSESTISLAGVNIATDTGPAIAVNTNGNITFLLVDDSVNTIRTSKQFEGGLHKNGSGILTIQGGTLGNGRLTATGGAQGAAIGSKNNQSVSNITITGGVVTANGGDFAAGIGGGNAGGATNILITGGNVTATGGYRAAGIGGGYKGTGSGITISGGNVVANGGGRASGIGGGDGGSGSNNKLDGNAVMIANSVEGFDEAAGGSWTKGIAFVGTNGTMYSDVTLPGSVSFPGNLTIGDTQNNPQTLTVPSGVVLTIPEGKTLTNATFGTIEISEGATIDCKGTISTSVTYDTEGAGDASPASRSYTYMQNNTQGTYGEFAAVGEVPIGGWYTDETFAEASKVETTSAVELNAHTLYANYEDTAWMSYAQNTLTLTFGQKPTGTINETVWHVDSGYTEATRPGWYSTKASDIKQVVVDETAQSFAPTSTAWWFAGLSNLETFTGLDELDWTALENTTSMFSGCSSLASLSLPADFTLSKVSGTNGQDMFSGLSSLTSLTLPKNFLFPESSGFDFGSSARFWRASVSEQMPYGDGAKEAWKTYLATIEDTTHTFTIATVDLTFLAGTGAHFTDDESVVELHLYGNANETIAKENVPVGILEGSVFKGYTTPGSSEVIPPDEITAFPATNTTYTASYVLLPFVVTGGVEGTDYEFDTDTYTLLIKTDKELSIANIESVTTAKNWQIKTTGAANLILAGVNIQTLEARSPLLLAGGADVSVKLLATTSNVLFSGVQNAPGIQKEAASGTLTISSTGQGTPGSLVATGGINAAGIGSVGIATQNITIASGNVTARGGSGAAGIGSASNFTCSDITISGGNVTARGGAGASGIGSGNMSTTGVQAASNISLLGGVIQAYAGESGDVAAQVAAGIGTSANATAANNVLQGNCVVYATSGGQTKDALDGFSAESGLLQGIAFTQKGTASQVGAMYGSVTLPQSVNFSANIAFGNDKDAPQTLTIGEGVALTIPSNVSLTNGLYGTVTVAQGGTLSCAGTIYTTVFYDTGGVLSQDLPTKDVAYMISNQQQTYTTLPQVSGYTVLGWYKESAYTNKVEPSTLTQLNLHTLYAKLADEAWMKYDDATSSLELSYGQKPEGVIEESVWKVETGYSATTPWAAKHAQDIQTFTIDSAMPAAYQPTSCAFWFAGLTRLQEVSNLDKLNTQKLSNIASLFEGCTSLETIALPNTFKLSATGNATSAFSGCTSLTSLSLGAGCALTSTATTTNMFAGCNALVSLTLPKGFVMSANSGLDFGQDTQFWIASISRQMKYDSAASAANDWTTYLAALTQQSHTFTQASKVLTYEAADGDFTGEATAKVAYRYGNTGDKISGQDESGQTFDYTPIPTRQGWKYIGYAQSGSQTVDTPVAFPAANTSYTACYEAYPLQVEGGTQGVDYEYDNAHSTLIIKAATPMSIKNEEGTAQTDWKIEIASTAPSVHLTLSGVNIAATDGPALHIPQAYTKPTELLVADGTQNSLTTAAQGCAAIQKDATVSSATLTIGIPAQSQGSGKLYCEAAQGGAAIGGGAGGAGSYISISGADVEAKGGTGAAAIGAGSGATTATTSNNISANAVIRATSGDSQVEALTGFEEGINSALVFTQKGVQGTWAAALYGNVTLTHDVSVPQSLSVGASSAQTLTLNPGVVLSLEGNSVLCNAAHGTINLKSDAQDPAVVAAIRGGRVTVNVSYSVPNGATQPSAQDFIYQQNDEVQSYGTLPTSSLDSHDFVGWFTQSEGKGTQIKTDDSVLLNQHTLYAYMPAHYCTVDFVVPEGTVDTPAQASVLLNTPVSQPAITWSAGTFVGWYTTQSYDSESKWDFTQPVTTNTLTLYGKFVCSVTFETNGGSSIESQTVLFSDKALRPEDPQREHARFVDWYQTPEFNTVFNFNASITHNTVVYAAWAPVITYYSVTFNTGGGSFVEQQIVKEGDVVIKPQDPTYAGFEFGGWYVDPIYTKLYEFNEPIDANIILYAKWVEPAQSARVIFDASPGSFTKTASTQFVVESFVGQSITAEEVPTPEYEGYTFEGWLDQNNVRIQFPYVIESREVFLHAAWKEIPAPVPSDTVTVTFNAGEGSWGSLKEITKTGKTSQLIVAPVYPTALPSKECVGWFDESGQEVISGKTTFGQIVGCVVARYEAMPGWHEDSSGWWYVEDMKSDYYANTWAQIDHTWFYFDSQGYCLQSEWGYINGEWYYFNSGGYMLSGWQYLNGAWYFLDRYSGMMHVGWVYDGVWYYCNPDHGGAMDDNCWTYIGGAWYGFNEGGSMTQGWSWSYAYDGWFYLEPYTGVMQTGWQYIGGHWYYFYDNGLMAANTRIEGYRLGADGAWN